MHLWGERKGTVASVGEGEEGEGNDTMNCMLQRVHFYSQETEDTVKRPIKETKRTHQDLKWFT